MFRITPLAAAMLAAFAAPLYAQTVAHPPASPIDLSAGNPQHTAPAEDDALPAVRIQGSAAPRGAFQAESAGFGGKLPAALRDVAQAAVVIPKAVFESQAATSFADALRNVPGITIGAAEGGSIGNNINLRGFTARTDVYLDGFRDRGQYYRDTFDLESIDVLYGPSSLYFGRGSTGGVINQVSKQPTLKKRADVSVMAGTSDRYRTTVDLGMPLSDTAAFRLNAFGQDLGSTRDVMKSKDYGVAPSVRFGIGTPTEITLSALIQHNNDQVDYGVPSVNGRPAPVGKSRFYGFTGDRTIQDVQTLSARIEHRFNDALRLRNETRFSHYRTDARESTPGAVLTGPLASSPALSKGNRTTLPLDSLYVKMQAKDRVINDHALYNTTEAQTKFVTGPFRHELLAGLDLSHETYSNQGYTATAPGLPSNTIAIVPLLDPGYRDLPAGTVMKAANHGESSANGLGLYLNDTVSIGKHWKVVGGVRWDRYSASVTNTLNAPAYGAQTNHFTSVRGGLIWQPDDWQSYYASYGTSFNPSLEALTLTNGQQALPPEKNRSYEIGSKWDLLGGGLSVTQSLFNIEKTNARTQNVDGTYTLDGDVRVRGYQLGVAGHLSDKWQVFGGYTYLNGAVREALDGTAGHTPANTPRNMLTLWTTYAFTPHWEAGGGPVFTSARYAANNNYVKVPGYTRWDAMAAYHAKRYDVQLNLLNLTNKTYYDSLIASNGGRAVPGIGRTFLATVNYRFF